MPLDDSIKISRLKIRNLSPRVAAFVGHRICRVGARHFARRVRAVHRDRDRVLRPTRYSRATLSASNTAVESHSPICAARQISWTADRTGFIGRNGTLDNPAALAIEPAAGARAGAAIDPCAALQTTVALRPDAATEVVFILGEAATRTEAHCLDREIPDRRSRFGFVRGDESLGELAGRRAGPNARPFDGYHAQPWLLYQTLACRVWARIGILPGQRSIRLSRSASGRDGVDGRRSRH